MKPTEALKYLRKFPVDLLFLDIQMPSLTGIEFYKGVQLALDSLKTSVTNLPENLAKGAEVVASKVAGVASDVAEGAGKIVNQGAKGLFSGIGTPLLVAGGLVGPRVKAIDYYGDRLLRLG